MKHNKKYLDAQYVIDHPIQYDERDVIDAKEYVKAYEDGMRSVTDEDLASVSEMFYVMVDDKKILSIHKTEKGAIDRKTEWDKSQFDGVFTVHKLEVED